MGEVVPHAVRAPMGTVREREAVDFRQTGVEEILATEPIPQTTQRGDGQYQGQFVPSDTLVETFCNVHPPLPQTRRWLSSKLHPAVLFGRHRLHLRGNTVPEGPLCH